GADPQTVTLSTASPGCTAPGGAGLKCQCDTCNNAAAMPCATNADCVAVGATVCGGKRCKGGANNGVPCIQNSECPGGGCGRAGTATLPNQCTDLVCSATGSCLGGSNCSADCTTDSECPGGTCAAGEGRCL